jgi:hypothetical protein
MGSCSVASLVFGFFFARFHCRLAGDAALRLWRNTKAGLATPFLLGMPIGFIGLYIRNHCRESLVYETARREGALSQTPVAGCCQHERDSCGAGYRHLSQLPTPFYLLPVYFITLLSIRWCSREESCCSIPSICSFCWCFADPRRGSFFRLEWAWRLRRPQQRRRIPGALIRFYPAATART